jgi:hypothetical protein
MANYTASNLLTAQAKLLGAYQSGDLRYNKPATFLEFLKNSSIMFPAFETLKTRDDRAVEAYYKKRASRSLTSARSHNHTGSQGDSAALTPSWVTYADPFKSTLKLADKNIYSMDEILSGEVENVFANFANGLESAAVAHLFNNRSGVNGAVADGTFNSVQDVFEITTANEKRLGQIIQSAMAVNKYGGNYTIFCDTTAWNKIMFYAQQGAGNSENLQFQFAGQTWVHSVDMYALAAALSTPYTLGFCIAVPTGMLGVLPWIPKQNRDGVVTSVNKYASILNPIDGLQYAVHSYEATLDGTSINGYTQDVKTEYEVSIDLAFTLAPLSVASETPALAFSLVNTLTTI